MTNKDSGTLINILMKVVDLFCGIGSFHHSAKDLGMECVFACDIDPHVRKVYKANWGLEPGGDITTLDLQTIPPHDILCGGFPCQPFSQIGQHRGTDDDRGRLVDYIIRILVEKKPKACVLENVPALLTSEGGATYAMIINMLEAAGYKAVSKILKASSYGIPQMRKRLFIVAVRSDITENFVFPDEVDTTPTLSEYMGMPFTKTVAYTIRCGGGHGTVGERHNWDTYEFEDGTHYRLNAQDCLKLQGFSESSWKWDGVTATKRTKMVGNTIPTCLSRAVLQTLQRVLTA